MGLPPLSRPCNTEISVICNPPQDSRNALEPLLIADFVSHTSILEGSCVWTIAEQKSMIITLL